MNKAALISITQSGDNIIDRLERTIDLECLLYDYAKIKEYGLKNVVKECFKEAGLIVFVSALGICVRAIAPHLKSKTTDPAVVAIANDGSVVISVVGGHLGGANEYTQKIADILGGTPVITTATDLKCVIAPDMIAKELGLYIDSMDDCKRAAAAIVNGGSVAIYDDKEKVNYKGYLKYDERKNYDWIIRITNRCDYIYDKCLNLIRKNIVLGVGCRKNYDADLMIEKTLKVLLENNIHKNAVLKVCSMDIKKQEHAIIELAKFLEAEFVTYSACEISKAEHLFEGSNYVKKAVGVSCVAEPCVHLTGAKIIIGKLKLDGMTLAIGEMGENE